MTDKPVFIEYDLADVKGFMTQNIRSLRSRGLRFLRYGNEFIADRGLSEPFEGLTYSDMQVAIESLGGHERHARRVYIACKHLAGAGAGLYERIRVFSSYARMEAYLDSEEDNPSPDADDVLTSMTTCVIDAVTAYRPCHCVTRRAQDDALEALEPALPSPENGGRVNALGATLCPSKEALVVMLQDGRRLAVPRSWFSFLDPEDADQWQGARLDGTREFIRWPRTRKRVAIAGLLGVH